MQAPPPFQQPGMPVKKRSPWTILAIVFGVFGVCCILPLGLLGGAGFWAFSKGKGMVECFASATEVGAALRAYQKANGGKMPPAATWQTELRKYIDKTKGSKEETPFKLFSSTSKWECTSDGKITGFAFNSELAGKKVSDIKDSAEQIAIFETTTAVENQAKKYVALPFSESPTVMGKSSTRGWIVIGVTGNMMIVDKSGKPKESSSSGFQFESGTSTKVEVKEDAPKDEDPASTSLEEKGKK